MSERQSIAKLVSMLRGLADVLENDPSLASQLLSSVDKSTKRRTRLRFDLYKLFEEGGRNLLQVELGKLDVITLRAIVRENGLDPSKLAEKWRTKERLVSFIITSVEERSKMGQVFQTNLDRAVHRNSPIGV